MELLALFLEATRKKVADAHHGYTPTLKMGEVYDERKASRRLP